MYLPSADRRDHNRGNLIFAIIPRAVGNGKGIEINNLKQIVTASAEVFVAASNNNHLMATKSLACCVHAWLEVVV